VPRSAPSVSAAQARVGQKELTRIERQISRLTDEESRLAAELAASASDYTRLIELGDQLRTVERDRTALEERWLVVAEEIGG
jgi:ATP-binding cassette subfamily F protein uup